MMQLDLFHDFTPVMALPQVATGKIATFPLARHVSSRSLALQIHAIPDDNARKRFFAAKLSAMIRSRQADGLTREAAVADVSGFAQAVKLALAYQTPQVTQPSGRALASVCDLAARRAAGGAR